MLQAAPFRDCGDQQEMTETEWDLRRNRPRPLPAFARDPPRGGAGPNLGLHLSSLNLIDHKSNSAGQHATNKLRNRIILNLDIGRLISMSRRSDHMLIVSPKFEIELRKVWRVIFLILIIRYPSLLLAQQPQAPTVTAVTNRLGVNAQWVNGVAPGYWPTAGTGLLLNLSAGTVQCLGNLSVNYPGGSLTMTASATNYVFLANAPSCAPSSNTTGFAGNVPIATVVTGTSSITSITDLRPFFPANTALKSYYNDAILHVSVNGNDSNDGFSWGSAKGTLGGAYAALPTCTLFGNSYTHCGTIMLGAGSFPAITSTLSITSPVHIIGIEDELSIIQCNVNAPCLSISMSPFSAVHGPVVENVRIENLNAGSSAAGVQSGAVIESVWRNIHFHGFSYAGQIAWLWQNSPNTFTERTIIDHVHLDGASTGMEFTDPTCSQPGASNCYNDFMYFRVYNLELNISNGQNGIVLANDVQVVGGEWRGVINTGVTSGGANVFWIGSAGEGTHATTAAFGTGNGAGGNLLANDVFFTIDNSTQTSSVTVWNIASGAQVWVGGQVIGSVDTAYSNSISGTFYQVLSNNFGGSSTNNQTDMVVQAHGLSGSPGNYYTLRFTNPASSRILQISDVGGNAGFTFSAASGSITMPTTAIAAGACGTTVSAAAGPTGTGNRIEWAYASQPGTADGLLKLNAWVTSGFVNFNQCNATGSSQTPGGIIINWEVVQ